MASVRFAGSNPPKNKPTTPKPVRFGMGDLQRVSNQRPAPAPNTMSRARSNQIAIEQMQQRKARQMPDRTVQPAQAPVRYNATFQQPHGMSPNTMQGAMQYQQEVQRIANANNAWAQRYAQWKPMGASPTTVNVKPNTVTGGRSALDGNDWMREYGNRILRYTWADQQGAQKFMGYGSPTFGLEPVTAPAGNQTGGTGSGSGGWGGGGWGWDSGGGGGGGGYNSAPEWLTHMMNMVQWKY